MRYLSVMIGVLLLALSTPSSYFATNQLLFNNDPITSSEGHLQLLGSNHNKDLAQGSATLSNRGKVRITVLRVFHDGEELRKDLVGAPLPKGAETFSPRDQDKLRVMLTNELVFAKFNHWNLVSAYGESIPPGAVFQIYMGVETAGHQTAHELKIVTDKGDFVFTMPHGALN